MATYTYKCENEECELEAFKFTRPMDEYLDPKECPRCGVSCSRETGDWCRNFKLKGVGWASTGYCGASNPIPSYKDELRKAGKDASKWDGI